MEKIRVQANENEAKKVQLILQARNDRTDFTRAIYQTDAENKKIFIKFRVRYYWVWRAFISHFFCREKSASLSALDMKDNLSSNVENELKHESKRGVTLLK